MDTNTSNISEAAAFTGSVFLRDHFGKRYLSHNMVINSVVVLMLAATACVAGVRIIGGLALALWTGFGFGVFGYLFLRRALRSYAEAHGQRIAPVNRHTYDAGTVKAFWRCSFLQRWVRDDWDVARFVEPLAAACLGTLLLALGNGLGIYVLYVGLSLYRTARADFIAYRERMLDFHDAKIESRHYEVLATTLEQDNGELEAFRARLVESGDRAHAIDHGDAEERLEPALRDLLTKE